MILSSTLSAGKLPPLLLERILRGVAQSDPRVVVGPEIGRDAAVIDFGDRYLVAKTDPITFATERIGWYAVHINANDVATMGAGPRWFLAALLLPESRTDESLVEAVMKDLCEACAELGVTLCGGHTEITCGLDRPMLVGQMLGEVAKERLVHGKDARPGDILLLTKGIAVEGTALLAREKAEILRPHLGEDMVARAARFLSDPGISVVREAMIACDVGGLHAMHDPTEGGLATGVWEMAHCAGCGVEIELSAVHVFPETRAICETLHLDPLGVIASGALLLAAHPEHAQSIVDALNQAGIPCRAIGRLTLPEKGMKLRRESGVEELPRFERDEVARLFAQG